MVKGLKVNDRVRGEAKKVLGADLAKTLFPEHWETLFLFGTIIKRHRGRTVSVQWDKTDQPHDCATRLLQREEPEEVAAAADVGGAAEAADNAGINPPAADIPRAGSPRDSGSDHTTSDDDSEDVLLADMLFDADEAPNDDDDAENDPGDDIPDALRELLTAHGLTWTRQDDGVVIDEPHVANFTTCIRWHDGLDHDRQPKHYFVHLYPTGNIPEMRRATNVRLEGLGYPAMSIQEYFQLLGLILAMSNYPKFTMRDMFTSTSDLRRSEFLAVPDLSRYMTLRRIITLLKHLTFAMTVSVEEQRANSFWRVQPLVTEFNKNRARNIRMGKKGVVDESMSEWKGKDQRFGKDGCPHVTKIARKPRSTGMEIKNLADVQSGIMMALEIVANKMEMRAREYSGVYGADTSLLLRLTKFLRGSGRIIVADSAFASVKSAVALKSQNGLYFLGMVKTAHKKFPKKYLQRVPIAQRGGHVVCTAEQDGVKLRAVGWNDGKKEKGTGTIIRKCIVGSCGTTLPGTAHRKRRWRVNAAGRATTFFVNIPRPMMVTEYFDGAQKIDVHNHLRQGGLGVRLETRSTGRWEIRFWQTIVGMVEVDAFLAYRRWCPGKRSIKHIQFRRVLTQQLLDNTIACPPDAPVLRPRPPINVPAAAVESVVHTCRPLSTAAYFIGRRVAAEAVARRPPQTVLKCRICRKNASFFCLACSTDTTKTKGLVSLCGPNTGRDCFAKHQTQQINNTDANIDDLI